MTNLRLYTLAEVAEETGLSLRSLKDGARRQPPKFDHIRDGGRRYMTEAQIIQMIKEREVSSKPLPSTDDPRLDGIRRRLAKASTRTGDTR